MVGIQAFPKKGFSFFFRGKLLVSAREKNTSQPLKIELGYPTLCEIELTITHHPKEPKKYRVSKTCSKHKFRVSLFHHYQDVSENSGTPKSSILIGFSLISHPFWGTPILGNTHQLPVVSTHPRPSPCLRPCRWVSITSESWT